MNRDILTGLARCTEAGTNRWIGKLAANPRYQEEAERRYARALDQVRFGWVRWRAMHYDRSLRR
jgi:hypothetical protein